MTTNKAAKKAIRVGDKLVDPTSGIVWKVIETRPGGRVALFNKESARFIETYHRQVKGWVDAPSQEVK